MNKLVVDLAAKRVGLLKSYQKKVKRKRRKFPQLTTQRSWQNKRACSRHVHLHQDTDWLREQEPDQRNRSLSIEELVTREFRTDQWRPSKLIKKQ